MDYVLKDLEPASVMKFFEAICGLPHGSKNTKIISDYCVVFARVRGLWCQQDKANNVIIRKEAAPGYEGHPTVIIQGHLDMVCEKEADHKIDFQRDGLSVYTEGDLIRARGTTLGADNGIAVAMALALLDNRNIPHPALEVVLTTDEEIGMLGAAALDMRQLKGKVMLNLDSDCEGTLTAGCAGGVKSTLTIPLRRENASGRLYTIEVSNLSGGHSGIEINKGHTNATLFAASLFEGLCEGHDIRLVSLNGGGQDNAIPREATLKFVSEEPLDAGATAYIESSLATLRTTEPTADISIRDTEATGSCLTRECTARIREFFREVPNGVQKMSEDIPDLVETSLNLGILNFDRGMRAIFALRSSVNKERDALAARLKALAMKFGGQYAEHGSYPAWEYRKESRLRETMQKVFLEQYGYECRVEVIHAGLECGLFSSKIRDLDCISFGPDMQDIHTPREALSISSTERTWKYLLEVLKAL